MSFGSAFPLIGKGEAEGMFQTMFIHSIFRKISQLDSERGKGKDVAYVAVDATGYSILPPNTAQYHYSLFLKDKSKNYQDISLMEKITGTNSEIIGLFNTSLRKFLNDGSEKLGWSPRLKAYQSAYVCFSMEKEIREMIMKVENKNYYGAALADDDSNAMPTKIVDNDIDFYQVCHHFLDITVSSSPIFFGHQKQRERINLILPFIFGKYLLHVRKLILMTEHRMLSGESEEIWKEFNNLLRWLDDNPINNSSSPNVGQELKIGSQHDNRQQSSAQQQNYQDLFNYSQQVMEKVATILTNDHHHISRPSLLKPLVEIIVSYIGNIVLEEEDDKVVENRLLTLPFFCQEQLRVI
jgi:hypothetical protein